MMNRKPNSSAGKGVRYRPSADAEEFGQANRISPGATISGWAKVPTQAHASSGKGGTSAPGDKSTQVRPAKKSMKLDQPGNALPIGSRGVRIR